MRALTAYAAPGDGGTSPKWVAAFARGASCPVQTGGPLREGDLAMFGSPRIEPLLLEAQRDGRAWYYGDHGFFERGRYYRCSRSTYQFDGLSGSDNERRFRSFGIPIRDWRKTGSHILLCPNSESFLRRHGHPTWVEDVTRQLKQRTDRKIRLRWKTGADLRPLELDLVDCWAVVAFTSNAAVEAILAGIPAICTRSCAGLSMASGSLGEIESPRMPQGREQWAARLANNQWTFEEMARGDLWRAIGVA